MPSAIRTTRTILEPFVEFQPFTILRELSANPARIESPGWPGLRSGNNAPGLTGLALIGSGRWRDGG